MNQLVFALYVQNLNALIGLFVLKFSRMRQNLIINTCSIDPCSLCIYNIYFTVSSGWYIAATLANVCATLDLSPRH